MMIFMYWLKNLETGEERHLVDACFYDIGSIVELDEEKYEVVDYAVDQPIGCHELCSMEV